MGGDEPHTSDRTPACTTTSSFADHQISDGSTLIRRTYHRLRSAHTEYQPTESFFDALESAFIWAYLGTTEERGVPEHVAAAIDDARAHTKAEFADQPSADLRTDIIPTFYKHVADFHCVYRDE
ncbi:hypothetical protein [Halovenus sp. HT40]|uniref:hypothetical protein n=1 Tax=Halovenus sp. HT40 TaxID=3126691 RepID=UPI00300F0AF6